MKLHVAHNISIHLVTPSTSEVLPTSEIYIAGVATGKILEGAALEAALTWRDSILLFLTNDVPFEETLNIYLLDENLKLLDLARMYYIYATGVFSALDLTQEDTVRFSFYSGKVWTLRLLPKQIFALPIINDPAGVHRPFRLFRRFLLEGQNQTETAEKPLPCPTPASASTGV